jgi:hypothetical protein
MVTVESGKRSASAFKQPLSLTSGRIKQCEASFRRPGIALARLADLPPR